VNVPSLSTFTRPTFTSFAVFKGWEFRMLALRLSTLISASRENIRRICESVVDRFVIPTLRKPRRMGQLQRFSSQQKPKRQRWASPLGKNPRIHGSRCCLAVSKNQFRKQQGWWASPKATIKVRLASFTLAPALKSDAALDELEHHRRIGRCGSQAWVMRSLRRP